MRLSACSPVCAAVTVGVSECPAWGPGHSSEARGGGLSGTVRAARGEGAVTSICRGLFISAGEGIDDWRYRHEVRGGLRE